MAEEDIDRDAAPAGEESAAPAEVPRVKLVRELARESDLFTTQQLKGKDFFHDTVVAF